MDLNTLTNTEPWEWPEGAASLLLGILRDRQAEASERLIAAELAGDLVVMNDQLAQTLLSILGRGDEPEELRAQASISLGPALAQMDEESDWPAEEDEPITKATYREIRRTLKQLYDDTGLPKAVRRRILEGSVRSPAAWHADAVRTAWASGDPEWTLSASFAMQYVRGFEAEILRALESEDAEIRYWAVVAAGNWELQQAWPFVVALVEDKSTEKELLLVAIAAVGHIRPSRARDVLGALEGSEDEDIAEAVSEALALAEAACASAEDDGLDDYDGADMRGPRRKS
jgi:hypothetical protein